MSVILIAFERESEQSALEQLLSGRGHRVMKSANGLVAWDTARREPPHAIISDIVLPRMDGFALCRKWKQDERLQSVPFLFYTRRHDDPKYERFALELGAERFLARSAQPESLLTALDEVLGAAAAANGGSAPAPSSGGALPQPSNQSSNQPSNLTPDRTALIDTTSLQRIAALETALGEAQRAHAELQRTHAEALEAMQRSHARALEDTGRRHAEAMASVQQANTRLQSQMTELEAANQRLAAGEARFRHVFEGNPAAMWIVDHASDGIIAVNDAALALFGYERSEFLALKAAALEDSNEASSSGALRAHRGKDGRVIMLARSMRQIEFDGHHADLVSCFDLSERIAEEQKLHEQDAAARAVQLRQTAVIDLLRGSTREDEATILRRALEQAAAMMSSPVAWLHFVDHAKNVSLAGWFDVGQRQATLANTEPRPILQGESLEACVKDRQAAASSDAQPKVQQDGLPALGRYLAVPAVVNDEVVAVLGVANRDADYDQGDQQGLLLLADGFLRIIQMKRMQSQTLKSFQRADVALQGMIDSFVRVGERHDPYTAGSARRLAALAVAIGREAGLDGERQHALRVAAMLHDIGNIAVPASILSKPAPLTETELALMRTHVDEGCQLLADIDFGAPIADIIYQSHERYDGSGYPRGLKAADILLESRILAIADTVEAMCSPRPYRPAADMAAAIEEIRRGAGRLYDPHLVEACIRLIDQHGFRLPE